MSRLSSGEREFVSDFGQLPTGPADLAPQPGAPQRPPVAGGTQELDARGISAPLPLLRAHRALRALQPGQELRVITTDPQSMAEFQALAKHVTHYDLVSQEVVGDEYVHLFRRRR